MANEPLPVKDFLDELDTQWNTSNVVEPRFIEVTGETSDPLRFDLNVKDVVVGRPGNPAFNEQPIGNWTYGNRTYNIDIELHTISNRQRLYNLVQEIRRICHARMHNLTNFQRIRFVNFQEMTTEQVNIWTGVITIQLENNAILLETT
tara:strand:- start:1579 stop:2022 length:444 start_codon:yes stop_codon:yes gene_type:complete